MIPELPWVCPPDWLMGTSQPLGPLPLAELLADSVYYPACGFDGRPIRYLAGKYHSFIYVDYGVERAEAVDQLSTFRGYAPAAWRDVRQEELTPQGWQPLPLQAGDGHPRQAKWWEKEPFALWAILERTPEYGPEHGPERFSLLYVGGDGVATFQALYHGNRATPAAVTIIQPGKAGEMNWTDFKDPKQVFARSVLRKPEGASRGSLLHGGF